jgi:hypothetical protein
VLSTLRLKANDHSGVKSWHKQLLCATHKRMSQLQSLWTQQWRKPPAHLPTIQHKKTPTRPWLVIYICMYKMFYDRWCSWPDALLDQCLLQLIGPRLFFFAMCHVCTYVRACVRACVCVCMYVCKTHYICGDFIKCRPGAVMVDYFLYLKQMYKGVLAQRHIYILHISHSYCFWHF